MKLLVALAVLGVCSASYQQAYHYNRYAAPYQPRWTGPVAATVPAGVDGTITPVSDTYEVSAARNAFFRAYNAQLAAVGAPRYGTPVYYQGTPAVHLSVAPAVHHTVYAHGGAAAPSTPVRDTPAVAAAKADFFRLYNLQAAAAAAAPDHDAPRYYY